MSILKKCKKIYDSIEIPDELEYVVNRAIHQKDIVHKRSNITYFIKGATVAMATTFALFIVLLNTNETFAKSMEEIPVISSLAKVFTVREYKEETDTELIEARVPAIQNTGNTELENRINNEISTKINNVLDEAKQRAKEYQEAALKKLSMDLKTKFTDLVEKPLKEFTDNLVNKTVQHNKVFTKKTVIVSTLVGLTIGTIIFCIKNRQKEEKNESRNTIF